MIVHKPHVKLEFNRFLTITEMLCELGKYEKQH